MPGVTGAKKATYTLDTLELVSLSNDSLILKNHGNRYGFHRKLNAMEANKEAQAKALKQ
jgi:hypothetical protein